MTKGPRAPKLVWRISEAHPQGAWVDPSTLDQSIPDVNDEVASGSSWASSTIDLVDGTDVREDELDTIPAELYDELFGPGSTNKPAA